MPNFFVGRNHDGPGTVSYGKSAAIYLGLCRHLKTNDCLGWKIFKSQVLRIGFKTVRNLVRNHFVRRLVYDRAISGHIESLSRIKFFTGYIGIAFEGGDRGRELSWGGTCLRTEVRNIPALTRCLGATKF